MYLWVGPAIAAHAGKEALHGIHAENGSVWYSTVDGATGPFLTDVQVTDITAGENRGILQGKTCPQSLGKHAQNICGLGFHSMNTFACGMSH